MYQWLIVLFNVLYFYYAFSLSVFNHHIKTYEIVDCYSFLPVKRNFTKFSEEDILKYEADAEVSFRAFNRDFHLLLYEDSNFQNLEVSHTSMKRNLTQTKFYEGIVKEHSLDSAVVGYLNDNVFSGSIKEKEVVYFIEPASSFLSAPIDSSKIVVYRSKDVLNKHQDHFEANSSESLLHLFPLLKRFGNRNYFPHGIKKTSNDTDYACQIEMVADHTLYEYFKKDIDTLSAFLYLHAKYADFIFRRTDFDGDGFPDNIRIIVKKIFIYKTASDPNYPMANAQDIVSFLNSFSLRSQNYCISFCLSHRSYKAPAVGQAFRPESQPFATPGGICQFPIWKRGVKRYFNTGVATIVNSRQQIMPLITTLLAVTHEMGHLFGSDHDPVNHLICSPGGNLGYYLMYPRTSKLFKPMNSHFSPCSRQQIHRIIQERGECLKSHQGTCGNGVREGAEECDCGWKKSCSHLDSCCTPSDAKPPEKGCTFRKNCSPKESKCCTRDCTVNPANGTECYKSETKCFVSLCDGVHAACPKPKQSPDRYPCQRTSKTCSRGHCNSSVCLDNNLQKCTCDNQRYSCVVCCKKDGACLPAQQLNLRFPYGSVFNALEGTPCKEGGHQCDGSGSCINSKDRKLELDENPNRITYWVLVVLSSVLFVMTLMFCYLLRLHYRN